MYRVPGADDGPVAPVERDLVKDLAELVVGRIDPDELVVFDETAEEYFADPERVLRPGRRDEPLGFGLEFALLAPYVLAVATPVVRFLLGVVSAGLQDELKPLAGRMVRRLFRGHLPENPAAPPAPVPVPVPAPAPVTREQARHVWTIAYRRAEALGLGEVRCRLLADSIVGGLVVDR